MINTPFRSMARQRGVTTLVVVLSLLVIITLVVLSSTNVALFEQKTATNENRQKLADQAAEYAINMSGEYMKANMSSLALASGNGWLATGVTKRWWPCPVFNSSSPHPCDAERSATRRAQMYFWAVSSGGSTALPYTSMTNALTNIGGASGSTFPVTTTVNALLCRIDTTLTKVVNLVTVPAPDCRATPAATSLNRIAITFVANSALRNADSSVNENANAVIKETWASYSSTAGAASVPLLASGTIEGLGNAEIVAAANGAGIGIPVSVWSPCPVDFVKKAGQTAPTGCTTPGGGLGSVSTCNLGEFLKATPLADLKTTCATSNSACGCPSFNTSNSDFLSGHSNSEERENVDILDIDNNAGVLPDITFFPGGAVSRNLDDPNDPLDDSLFEWIFGQEVVTEGGSGTVNQNCGSGSENCALVAIRDTLGGTVISTCSQLNGNSSGLFYVTGDCDMPSAVGSATDSVIVVVDGDNQGGQDVRVGGNTNFFGLLFIRSNNDSAVVKGNGNLSVFGSMVVEGVVKITGGIRIIYENTQTDSPGKALPATTRFARVPGSWLDAGSSF